MIDPRDLEDIRNTLQTPYEHRTIDSKGVPDREELSKCNTIIEQAFQRFEVIYYFCHIIIVFSHNMQFYPLVALWMNSDNTRHRVNMLSVSLYR